jgi:hypothetical protein
MCTNNKLDGSRYILSEELVAIDWNDLEEEATHIICEKVQGCFCSEEQALAAGNAYLANLKSNLTWSDILPVERCGICDARMKTDDLHQALSVTVECGPANAPEILDVYYLARFCQKCVPVICD